MTRSSGESIYFKIYVKTTTTNDINLRILAELPRYSPQTDLLFTNRNLFLGSDNYIYILYLSASVDITAWPPTCWAQKAQKEKLNFLLDFNYYQCGLYLHESIPWMFFAASILLYIKYMQYFQVFSLLVHVRLPMETLFSKDLAVVSPYVHSRHNTLSSSLPLSLSVPLYTYSPFSLF